MSSGNFKHDLFAQFAVIGKALGHANRLELLEFLAQGERNVEELAKIAGLSVANTSRHLQQLRQAGLILSRKEGLKVFYRISGDDIIGLMDLVRNVAERHLAEVDRLVNSYLAVKDKLEPIPREELLERARDDLVTVIDVRPSMEYEAGHVSGAINVPLAQLEQHLDQFPRDQEIVAYCRGPHCVLAFDAIETLRLNGYQARRLEDGFPEWKAAGLPVE